MSEQKSQRKVISSTRVSDVWSGQPVPFDFLVSGGRQYAVFYDGERRMTVAARGAGEGDWKLVRLEGAARTPRRSDALGEGVMANSAVVGWDSHNGLTLAVDRDGFVHISGNMHNHPLVYFRTRVPHDISSFERIDRMTGEKESACTYPVFLVRPDGELVFRYRDGLAGNGADYYNIYDVAKREWRRLLERPLLDGLGRMSPYAVRPIAGSDGRFHVVYCWRDTPDVATNHDIGYMRSQDLVRWENAAGEALELPVVAGCPTLVDPVPVNGGLLNARQRVGFDAMLRPVISYTKFDADGKTQAYCARFADGRWDIRQISNWSYRWELTGGGCIPNGNDILLEPVTLAADGSLHLRFDHIVEGSGGWQIDPETLGVMQLLPPENKWPEELKRDVSGYPGMQSRILPARGQDAAESEQYVLRWATLGENRDEPRAETPPASELRCYRLMPT